MEVQLEAVLFWLCPNCDNMRKHNATLDAPQTCPNCSEEMKFSISFDGGYTKEVSE